MGVARDTYGDGYGYSWRWGNHGAVRGTHINSEQYSWGISRTHGVIAVLMGMPRAIWQKWLVHMGKRWVLMGMVRGTHGWWGLLMGMVRSTHGDCEMYSWEWWAVFMRRPSGITKMNSSSSPLNSRQLLSHLLLFSSSISMGVWQSFIFLFFSYLQL